MKDNRFTQPFGSVRPLVALAATGIIEANLRFKGTTSSIERREEKAETSESGLFWSPTVKVDREGTTSFGLQGRFRVENDEISGALARK